MMQPANLRNRDHPTPFRRFNLALNRGVPIQGQVGPRFVVIIQVLIQNPQQVSLVEHDDVMKALASDGADHPLRVRILPGRSWCYYDFFDSHVLDTLAEELAVDGVAIAKQEAGC